MKHLLTVSLISLLLLTCKENPLEIEPNYPPGRRDYTWTQDTIKYPSLIYRFCGENINNVWALDKMGYGNRCILRFDGTNWNQFNGTMNEPMNNINNAYYNNGNVWFISSYGEVWKYQNNNINKEAKFNYQNDDLYLADIIGKSENEIVAVGARGTSSSFDGAIVLYDGKKWTQKELLNGYGNFIISAFSYRDDKYYIVGFIVENVQKITYKLYEYDRTKLKVIWKNVNNEPCSINNIDGNLIATLGNTVHRYKDEKFELVFEDKDPDFGGRVYGRNKNDLVVRMLHGVKHWNGTDLQYILRTPNNIEVGGAMLVLEKDIFIRTHDYKTNYTIIYHGTLK